MKMSKPSPMDFAINVDAVKSELEQRKLTLADASRKIGKGSGYLKNRLTKGSFTPSDAILFETLFNIPRSLYEVKEEKVEEEVEQDSPAETISEKVEVHFDIDYDKLYQTVYTAVVAGIKEGFK